jgi:DNA-directed RNA polymerase subunit RPC12/RpoP
MNEPDDTKAAQEHIACPYCNSIQTDLFSLFGQQLLTVQYYCQSCHTPFEAIKDDDVNHYASPMLGKVTPGKDTLHDHND